MVQNTGDKTSLFLSENVAPTSNPLIKSQIDPTAPQTVGLSLVSDPALPTKNAQEYVKNFDPNLYDLRDTSHLMRFIRACVGASGLGGIRKQVMLAKLSNMLTQGAFLDLDTFYGAVFGLQRRTIETMPVNDDGTVVNPYTDVATSDVWDQAAAADASYRARLFNMARAINLGATYAGLKGVAEAILSCEVDLSESWAKTDFLSLQGNIVLPTSFTYGQVTSTLITYGGIEPRTYGDLTGQIFGSGDLPAGNRGEIVITPHRGITQEERYQLQHVLNAIKPAHTMVTVGDATIESISTVPLRGLGADTSYWQIENRVTQSSSIINPPIPIYLHSTAIQTARPAFGDYSGEQWSSVSNVAQTKSYRLDFNNEFVTNDDENVVYLDGTSHNYASADGVKDAHQAAAVRLSGEGVVSVMPFTQNRAASS